MNVLLLDLATVTASRLARKWRQDRDDIKQDLLEYMVGENIDEQFQQYETDEEFDEAYKELKGKLWWHGMKVCDREARKAKAFRGGYSPDDEYFYSLRQLEGLLEHYYAAGIEERPPASYRESGGRHTDPAEGGNYLASMVDLKTGLEKLDREYPGYVDRLALRYDFLAGYRDEAVAGLTLDQLVGLTGWTAERLEDLLGHSRDAVRHRCKTALKALQRMLGGPSPYKAA